MLNLYPVAGGSLSFVRLGSRETCAFLRVVECDLGQKGLSALILEQIRVDMILFHITFRYLIVSMH